MACGSVAAVSGRRRSGDGLGGAGWVLSALEGRGGGAGRRGAAGNSAAGAAQGVRGDGWRLGVTLMGGPRPSVRE
jgi:hypothetical protein